MTKKTGDKRKRVKFSKLQVARRGEANLLKDLGHFSSHPELLCAPRLCIMLNLLFNPKIGNHPSRGGRGEKMAMITLLRFKSQH